ncbi:lysophospholipase [Rhizobium leguminosarum]|uniref:lysophospholipase n=1 Tax=Rhizobium leguminosarum TaxID=384 RepID=UPI001FDF471A|nr:lysophospholipase [Rhizobium leguminosarum]
MKFNPAEHTTGDRSAAIDVEIAPFGLPGGLRLTSNPRGVIVFAHGSGSSRHSPRNVYVTEALRRQDFATLLFDLLSEREAADRSNVFDISLLSARLIRACETVLTARHTRGLPMGLFGASTGRPDLAGAVLKESGRRRF